jgi:xylitol oxidase
MVLGSDEAFDPSQRSLQNKCHGEKIRMTEKEVTMNLMNWAGNYAYRATRLHEPETMDELRRVVSRAESIRALGTRHAFNDVGDAAALVSLGRLPGDVVIDRDALTVTVPAGMTYGALAAELVSNGLALHAMASLPHISVGGAIQTGTHGSGDRNGSLATAVRGLELVGSEGDIVTVARGDDDFDGMVVGLGALGIVTRVTLDIEPMYDVRQWVYLHLGWNDFGANVDAITSAAESVSLLTDYGDEIDQVWLKRREDGDWPEEPETSLFGSVPADRDMHPIMSLSAVTCTPQMGVPGSWADRLPHFRVDATPSSGEEIQSEYVVDREHLVDALATLRSLSERIRPHLQVTEIRTIAADNLWLSMAHGRESAAIHFTWKREPEAVERLLPVIEAALEPFAPRPHWGKTFAMGSATMAERYPHLDDFWHLQRTMDPRGAFRNGFLNRLLDS